MVNHYRWDFIGLSTDDKPTPATSEKVADGSTFYCSDNSKLYVWYKNQWYEKEATGGGEPYVLPIASSETLGGIKVGTGLSIDSETGALSVEGGSGPTVVQTIGTSTTDVMSQNATTSMVYNSARIGNGIQIGEFASVSKAYTVAIGSGNNSAQGTFVKEQYGVAVGPGATVDTGATSSVAIGPWTQTKSNDTIAIGNGTTASGARSIAIGGTTWLPTSTSGGSSIAIGNNATATKNNSIAIGSFSEATTVGEMNIGTGNTTAGYNSTNYRLLSGVYDGQGLHDAATLAQGNTLATAAPTTSTVGVLGQLYTDTTNMHTYQLTAIDTTDPNNPSYTWTQRW